MTGCKYPKVNASSLLLFTHLLPQTFRKPFRVSSAAAVALLKMTKSYET
jgi:hypothetical protein